jgi:hypothetical protein
MSIQKGDPLPKARIFELDAQGTPHAVIAAERFEASVSCFCRSGSIHPDLPQVHLPSFAQQADAIKAKGPTRSSVWQSTM